MTIGTINQTNPTSPPKEQRNKYKNRIPKTDLAEGAMEDEGVLALDGLEEVRDFLREGVARVVVRPRYVRVVAPLLVP